MFIIPSSAVSSEYFIASGLVELIAGFASAVVLASFSWWAPLVLGGAWVSPGLIDCHTHLVFGGNRAGEFEQRLGGASYEEIARAGGGIVSTVAATRAASVEQLA